MALIASGWFRRDDSLTSSELRAKNEAATALFLESGLVTLYQVEARAVIRQVGHCLCLCV